MKKTLMMLGVLGLVCLPLLAQTPASLYDQEGTADDGYTNINAAGQGPFGGDADDYSNWIYQYGGGSWSGVYGDGGWIEETSTGDSTIEIECDIEMYYMESFSNNKIYFHIGNPFTAGNPEKTAYVDGTVSYNNGMYIGISLYGTGKTEDDLVKDGNGDYTGEIIDAMVGTIDVLGRDISDQAFNARFLLDWGTGYMPPITYGSGSQGTQVDVLWWLVDDGNIGTYNLTWQVRLYPDTYQPDGNYFFDPAIVAAAEL